VKDEEIEIIAQKTIREWIKNHPDIEKWLKDHPKGSYWFALLEGEVIMALPNLVKIYGRLKKRKITGAIIKSLEKKITIHYPAGRL